MPRFPAMAALRPLAGLLLAGMLAATAADLQPTRLRCDHLADAGTATPTTAASATSA